MEYIEKSYDEKLNTLHKTHVYNQRTGADLGNLLPQKSFSLQEFIMNRDGGFQPNSTTLTLSVPRDKLGGMYRENINLKNTVLQIPVLEGYDFSEPLFEGWDFSTDKWIEMDILVWDLLKKGDKLTYIDELEEETYQFFEGYVTNDPKVRVKNSSIELTVEVKDRTYQLLKEEAKEDIFRQGWYICNNTSTETSLLHFLAGELGFRSDQMEFEDILYQGEHVGVPIVKIDKGSVLLQEFAEACRAVEARFHMIQDKLVVKSYLNESTSDYVFDKRNILTALEDAPMELTYSQVKVTYERMVEKHRQLVWALVGNDGTVDDAKIKINADTTEENNNLWWKVDFRPSGVVTSYEEPEILAKLADGTEVELEYIMELENNGGKLKLLNTRSEDVFLDRFKIFGKPIQYTPGNTITYPDDATELNTNEPAKNKYIQGVNIAALKAKNTYNYECQQYSKVSFETNVSRWLTPGTVCRIEHEEYKNSVKEILIESLTRSASGCQVVGRPYLGAVDAGDLEQLDQSGASDDDLAGSNLDNVVTVDPDRPPAPVVRSTEPNVGGIVIKLEEYPRTDISTFEFRLTMVNDDHTPMEGGPKLVFYYYTTLVPIMLSDESFYGKTWQVEVRAIDLKSKFSDWSIIDENCYAVSLKMPSGGIAENAITTAHLQFSNNDAIYVDEQGYTRIRTKYLYLDGDTQITGMLKVFAGDKGITTYNGTTEANSTKKTVITGGQIEFWEKG